MSDLGKQVFCQIKQFFCFINYRTSRACETPSTSTPKPKQSTKRKNDKKIEGEIACLLEESKKARKEIERHLNEKRSVADAYFESCALRMEKLPQEMQSFVQLQISQIFINAENPTLQLPITPLPYHITNIQQHITTPRSYDNTGNNTPQNLLNNNTPHSYILSGNSPQQYYSSNTKPEPYHTSGNTTPQPQQRSNNATPQSFNIDNCTIHGEDEKAFPISISTTSNPHQDILAASIHIANCM